MHKKTNGKINRVNYYIYNPCLYICLEREREREEVQILHIVISLQVRSGRDDGLSDAVTCPFPTKCKR